MFRILTKFHGMLKVKCEGKLKNKNIMFRKY